MPKKNFKRLTVVLVAIDVSISLIGSYSLFSCFSLLKPKNNNPRIPNTTAISSRAFVWATTIHRVSAYDVTMAKTGISKKSRSAAPEIKIGCYDANYK